MLDFEVVGQGKTTKIYRDGNTAIKLYADAPYDPYFEAENEAERQRFAYSALLPVPAVYGVRRLDEKSAALDMEYIAGQPLLHPLMDKDERNNAILTLVKLQCEVHKVKATGQPSQVERLERRIRNTPFLDDSMKDKLCSKLISLDDGSQCLCHGDFHPLNILNDGNKHWIIDWVDATSGNPLADACRTYLIFKEYISRSAGVYLRLFCKEASARKDDVLAWLPIIAAARLGENMDEKSRAWLLSFVIMDFN